MTRETHQRLLGCCCWCVEVFSLATDSDLPAWDYQA